MRRLSLSLFLISLPLAAGTTYGKLPLSFEPNQGQADGRVKFFARAPGYTLFVTSDEAVFAGRDGSVERMKLIGANRKMRVESLDKQPGISNYFIGNDPAKWRINIPNYGRVAMREVYPGIDLIFYGHDRQLEYDWVVAPGADPKQIRVKWEHTPNEDSDGDLTLGGGLRQKKPLIRQDGKAVGGGYVVRGKQVGFKIAKYDATKSLVIDPVLLYSTYLGGSSTDQGNGIAVDGAGNVYVTGYTQSTEFPTRNPLQASLLGWRNAFVTKINAAGSAFVYSTYLGGSSVDQGNGIAVDGTGNTYVTGYTTSSDFPTINPLQASNGGGGNADAFVTKLNSAGSALVYSTYLGGSYVDQGNGIAVDGMGNAYVTGYTSSTNFPTANPLQASIADPNDAFVTKINAAGSAFVYSTYLGGSSYDQGQGIAVDSSGNAYVTGYTQSTDFPTTNPLQGNYGGLQDAFVTKINAAGSAFVYSTYLGGSGVDQGNGIAVDGVGNAYVTGSTESTDFPTTNPLQASNHGGYYGFDAFVTKLNTAGSARVYSTYLGESWDDYGTGIALDGSGNAYVTGSRANLVQRSLSRVSLYDVFVIKINAAGSARVFSAYLGGSSGTDQAAGIAVDGAGNAHVTGSTGFVYDAFVLSISGASDATNAVAVFRDAAGSVWLSSSLTTASFFNSGGAFASDPAAAQDPAGDTFLVARDNSNSLSVNEFDQGQNFSGWTSAGGTVLGQPAIAVTAEGTAFFMARDASNAFWLNSYTPGIGFGGWVALGGSFGSDPAIAAGKTCPSNLCTLYLVGKDNSNAIWTATYSVLGGFSGWNSQGAVVNGTPSVTVGVDGAAYIAVRDMSNAMWMGRQSGAIFTGWQSGSGTITTDPQVAGSGGNVYAVALASGGMVWYNTFTEGTGNNWTGWTSPGGPLASVTAAATAGSQLFFVGQDTSKQLWWYETPGAGWKIQNPGFNPPTGALSAAPR